MISRSAGRMVSLSFKIQVRHVDPRELLNGERTSQTFAYIFPDNMETSKRLPGQSYVSVRAHKQAKTSHWKRKSFASSNSVGNSTEVFCVTLK